LREEIRRLKGLIFDAAGSGLPTPTATLQAVAFANEGQQFLEDDLDTMSEFISRIGASSDLSRRFNILKEDLLKQKEDYRELRDEQRGTNGKQRRTLDEIHNTLVDLIPRNNRLAEADLQLKRDLIKAARQQRDRNQRYYEISKWGAIVFYTIGWVLGLLGKVYGISGVEGAA
jgi:hypothetical protein